MPVVLNLSLKSCSHNQIRFVIVSNAFFDLKIVAELKEFSQKIQFKKERILCNVVCDGIVFWERAFDQILMSFYYFEVRFYCKVLQFVKSFTPRDSEIFDHFCTGFWDQSCQLLHISFLYFTVYNLYYSTFILCKHPICLPFRPDKIQFVA